MRRIAHFHEEGQSLDRLGRCATSNEGLALAFKKLSPGLHRQQRIHCRLQIRSSTLRIRHNQKSLRPLRLCRRTRRLSLYWEPQSSPQRVVLVIRRNVCIPLLHGVKKSRKAPVNDLILLERRWLVPISMNDHLSKISVNEQWQLLILHVRVILVRICPTADRGNLERSFESVLPHRRQMLRCSRGEQHQKTEWLLQVRIPLSSKPCHVHEKLSTHVEAHCAIEGSVLLDKCLKLGQCLVKALPSLPLTVGIWQALEIHGEIGAERLQGHVTVPTQWHGMWTRPDCPIQLLLERQLFEGCIQLHLSHSLADSATMQIKHLQFTIFPKAPPLREGKRLARRHKDILRKWLRTFKEPMDIGCRSDEIFAGNLEADPTFSRSCALQQAISQPLPSTLKLSKESTSAQSLRKLT
mmetsp:Transcript_1724/g.4098  ORF Transcript_1724/g.4098 Transcript_1724/m.4098 type:complete len:410 (-) Transcript_1724:106-1335(-)